VAHKIGYHWDYDGWVNNDAGIVSFTGADGVKKAYVVSYFSQRAGTEAIGYSFGAKLSRTVWDFMAPRYGIYSAPAAPWYPPTYQPPPATAEPTASPAPVTEPPVVTPTPKPATPTPKPVTATPKPATPTPKPPTPTPTQVPTPTATPQPSPGASNERR